MAHTPGPWREYLGKNYQVIGKNNYCVFLVGDTERVIPNPDDARLIAAAPLLLECLKETASLLESFSLRHELNTAVIRANQAIAKAEGR